MIKVLSIAHSEHGGGLQTVFRINNKISDREVKIIKACNTELDSCPDVSLQSSKLIKNKFKKIIKYYYNIYNYKALVSYLKKNEVDIIHIHGHGYLSVSVLSAIKKYKGNAKVILTSHGYGLICPNYNKFCYTENRICNKCVDEKKEINIIKYKCDRRGRLFSILKYIEFIMHLKITNKYNLYDKVIVPSQYSKECLTRSKYIFKDIVVVNNPIQIENKNIDVNQKENNICYIGRFSKEKNIELLIKSFIEIKEDEKYKDYKLILIGDGEEKKEYIKLINSSSVKEDIFISSGFMELKDAEIYLKKSKVLVLPSIFPETFGLVIFEAIRYNIIPIALNIGAQHENIIKLGVGESNVTNSINHMSNSIKMAIDNYYNNEINLDIANDLIDEEYSIEKYKFTIKEIYKEVYKNANITDM